MSITLVHRAYDRDLRISQDTPHWIFNQSVFFCSLGNGEYDLTDTDDLEQIAACSYSQGDAKEIYVLTIDSYIHASALEPDAIAEAEIARLWGAGVDAWDAVRGEIENELGDLEDGGWHIQRIRAELANRLGFEAVVDSDEQGEVWIVDFTGRNDELNNRLRYAGNYEDIRE